MPCVVLSPMLAFLLAIAIEILIGCLMDVGAPALLTLLIAGAGSLFLFRKLHPQGGSLSRDLSSRPKSRENRAGTASDCYYGGGRWLPRLREIPRWPVAISISWGRPDFDPRMRRGASLREPSRGLEPATQYHA